MLEPHINFRGILDYRENLYIIYALLTNMQIAARLSPAALLKIDKSKTRCKKKALQEILQNLLW
jgi:hypothetical protein